MVNIQISPHIPTSSNPPKHSSSQNADKKWGESSIETSNAYNPHIKHTPYQPRKDVFKQIMWDNRRDRYLRIKAKMSQYEHIYIDRDASLHKASTKTHKPKNHSYKDGKNSYSVHGRRGRDFHKILQESIDESFDRRMYVLTQLARSHYFMVTYCLYRKQDLKKIKVRQNMGKNKSDLFTQIDQFLKYGHAGELWYRKGEKVKKSAKNSTGNSFFDQKFDSKMVEE